MAALCLPNSRNHDRHVPRECNVLTAVFDKHNPHLRERKTPPFTKQSSDGYPLSQGNINFLIFGNSDYLRSKNWSESGQAQAEKKS